MFRFSDGQRFSPADRVAYEILRPFLQPSWYQIAQTGPKSIEVRFVTKVTPDDDYQGKIRAGIPALLRRADIAVSFKQFDAVPTPPGRKHIMFVNEYENPFAG